MKLAKDKRKRYRLKPKANPPPPLATTLVSNQF